MAEERVPNTRGLVQRYVLGGLAALLLLPIFVLGFNAPLWMGLVAAGMVFGAVALFASVRTSLEAPSGAGGALKSPGKSAALKLVFADALPALERLDAVVEATPKNLIRDRLERMAALGRKILAEVEADSSRLPAVQRLLTYYLPRAAEIAAGYAELREKEGRGQARFAAIEDVLAKMEDVFKHYAERLVDEDMRDLDTEIKLVKESMDEDLGGKG
jgi:hypothetical protein